MTVHSTAFPTDQKVAAAVVAEVLLPPAATAPPVLAARKLNLRKLLLAGAAIAALAGAAWYGWDYWTVGRYLVSTDDAYVRADSTTIAPKVTGYLQQVLVKDNERVATGQVLARIDDRDFKVALDQARADVAAAAATIDSKQAQLDVQQAVINAAWSTSMVALAALMTARWTSSWACLLVIVAPAAATSALAWSSATLKSRSSMRASTWPVVTRSLSFTSTCCR